MNFAHLQRRAFLIASITLVIAVAAALSYWRAVAKGTLPSPVQTLVKSAPAAADIPAAVGARAAPLPPAVAVAASPTTRPVPAPATPPTLPTPAPSPELTPQPAPAAQVAPVVPASSPAMPTPATEAAARPSLKESPISDAAPTIAGSNTIEAPRPAPIAPPSRVASAMSLADQALAAHWLSNTNDRPVIRVHYDPADILRLSDLGRGLIVAGGAEAAPARELYLLSKPNTPPLFAPYTKSVADRFSSYSLTLDSSLPLAELSAALPVYFPHGPVLLSFVPDQALAMQIFAEVAKNSRLSGNGAQPAHRTVDGRLALRDATPEFAVLEHGR